MSTRGYSLNLLIIVLAVSRYAADPALAPAADTTKSPGNAVALEGRAAATDGRWKIPYIQSANPNRRPALTTLGPRDRSKSISGTSAFDRLQSSDSSHSQVRTFSEIFSSSTKKTSRLPLPNDGLEAGRNRTLIQNLWDDHPREAVTSHAYPWRCIGWVNGGTGTLVGPNLVLTAAHVVIDEGTGQLYPNIGYFYLNRVDSNCYRKSWIDYIWWGTNMPNADRAHDWAILKLADRPGDEVGWMGVANTDYFYPSNFPAPLSVTGYSYDYNHGNTATVDQNVSIRSIDAGLLHHDGSTRGARPAARSLDTSPTTTAEERRSFTGSTWRSNATAAKTVFD